jgi:hypothetical protein
MFLASFVCSNKVMQRRPPEIAAVPPEISVVLHHVISPTAASNLSYFCQLSFNTIIAYISNDYLNTRFRCIRNDFHGIGRYFFLVGNTFQCIGSYFYLIGNSFCCIGNSFRIVWSYFRCICKKFYHIGKSFCCIGNSYYCKGNIC